MKARVGVTMAAAVFLAAAGAAAQIDQGSRHALTVAAGSGCALSWGQSACVFIQTGGVASLGVNPRGTWSGTVVAEGSVGSLPSDGATEWVNLLSVTTTGTWIIDVAGYKQIRIRANALASGTVIVNTWSAGPTSASAVGVLATSLGKAEDAAHANGDVGVMALAVRNDTASVALAGANGDYAPIAVDDNGRVFVHQDQASALPTGAATEATLAAASAKLPATLGQTTMAGSLSVAVASDQTVPVSAASLPLPTGAATAAKQPALGTAGVASADVITVQGVASMTALTVANAALSVTGGGVEATALRVTLASDSTGVVSVDDNGASLTVDNAALSVVGGGVEATALRVTLASDSTGVVSVDDNGGSLTVDGTVTVTDGAGALNVIVDSIPDEGQQLMANSISVAIASDQSAIQTAIASFPDNEPFNAAQWGGTAVAGGSGTATAGSPRVVLATDVALPAGTNNIGDVDVDSFPAAATIDTALTGQTADFDVEAATANMRFIGFTARESAATAAAATVVLRHGVLSVGNCTAGGVIAFIELAPNESVGSYFDGRGLAVASGVCADVIAGTVDLGIFTVTEASP